MAPAAEDHPHGSGAGDAASALSLAVVASGLLPLVAMSIAMFVGALVAGYIPFFVTLPPARLRGVSLLAAGLLVGTALVVIIPEGVHMWVSAAAAAAASESLKAETGHAGAEEHVHEHGHGDGGHEAHEHGHAHGEGHWLLGASLALGFAFMVVVEKISGGHGHAHAASGSGSDGSAAAGSTGAKASATSPAVSSGALPDSSTASSRTAQTAMLGLVIHAAVDGVALGASCFNGGSDASLLIFFAIMLHKAPAAFGLSVYLTQHGCKARDVRRQLLFFSLAAPVGAFVTYYGMSVGVVAYRALSLALVMLFSAGTFLFVATVHILPELTHGTALSWTDVTLIVAGLLLPILINVEHGH